MRVILRVVSLLLLVLGLAIVRVQASSAERGSRLVDLAKEGRFNEVAELARQGADEFQDSLGNTPLTYAVKSDHVEAVLALLDAGFSVTHANNEGHTVLDLALHVGDPVLVESIIEHFWKLGVDRYVHLLRMLQRNGSLPLQVQQRILHVFFVNAEFEILRQGRVP